MTYIKLNDTLYPAFISGRTVDNMWGNRESKAITLDMAYADAMDLFVNDMEWSIVYENDGSTEVYDNSDFCMAGPITDNRDGSVTVKMGKLTDREILSIVLGEA